MDPQNTSSDLDNAVTLSTLIAYQPGAVVSRTLVKQPAGTVTLFAFDVDEGLSEHTAPYDALVLSVEGDAEIRVSGMASRLTAGQAMRLPANQPHAVKALTPFKMLLVMVRA